MSAEDDERIWEMRQEETLWTKVQGLLGMENRPYYDKTHHAERSLANQPQHEKFWKKHANRSR